MNHIVQRNEQYAHIKVEEEVFNSIFAAEFETIARTLLREGYSNLIVNFAQAADIDSAGLSMLKKINMLCSRELGIMVLVTENDEFIDQIIDAKLRDVTILPTLEEAVDAVFMHDLENEFSGESDDFEEDELEAGGYSRDE
jgi:anti-anti-sigma regulatory factor